MCKHFLFLVLLTFTKTLFAGVGVFSSANGSFIVREFYPNGKLDIWCCGDPKDGHLGRSWRMSSRIIFEMDEQVDGVYIAGYNHTLIIDIHGDLWVLGNNYHGQLGLSSQANHESPTKNPFLTNLVFVAAGADHSLALDSRGDVHAFGSNYYGQIGAGDIKESSIPRLVACPQKISYIAAGDGHSLLIDIEKNVWTFGYNHSGQLGLGDRVNRSVPEKIPKLYNIVCVSGGYRHSLALDENGNLWSFGENQFGELGLATAGIASGPTRMLRSIAGSIIDVWNLVRDKGYETDALTSPVKSPLSNIKSIACGSHFSVVLDFQGNVWAFGGIDLRGPYTKSDMDMIMMPSPEIIPELNNAISIAAGSSHCLVVKSDGSVWGFGSNFYGQLGSSNKGSGQPSHILNLWRQPKSDGNN